MNVLEINNISKTYRSGKTDLTVLKDINFSLPEGSSCSIVGPSGSGKSTLLGLCAGLDSPTTGTVAINDIILNDLNEDKRAQVRNKFVGFIFQNFQLVPTLTALENVMVPLELRGERGSRPFAEELLKMVGLEARMGHYPVQLSGGEQQRVAIARAFINKPKILFADEPTGNLDGETSEIIAKLLFDLNATQGTTLVLVTHDLELARNTQRIIRLKSGTIVEDSVTA
ncbi:MAG TPA: ABC transporter ATP-binding protein [Patescibacteria group bacterium]|nr:ABC transporter ATP-binding protein [Patescibacteria group bacterium]